MIRGAAWCAPLLVALLLSCCAVADNDEALLVMAAASLTDAFGEIEVAFEAANPDIDVQLNFAGSGALREQIVQGAPADVFASANAQTMQALVATDLALVPMDFASNELRIAVPTGNPGGITSIDDLANSELLVGLCGAQVPCGQFARQALEQAGVEASVDTNEGDVRTLLGKIEAGELDVGVVYASDIAASDEVDEIALPPTTRVEIAYPIAVLTESPNPDDAAAFVLFVLSSEGQTILRTHGFGP
ncbi:MAG: molybdate transport system substrate-binding protein [Acidimicrobiales bacterium]|jgi:molybdate transport system substrate-binding protein